MRNKVLRLVFALCLTMSAATILFYGCAPAPSTEHNIVIRNESIRSSGGYALTDMPDFSTDFLPISAEYLASGGEPVAPASFSEDSIHYKLMDNVLLVDNSVTQGIASAGQLINGGSAQLRPNKIVAGGGYIPESLLEAAASSKGRTVNNGMIVVDTSSGTAFKVVSKAKYGGIFGSDSELYEDVDPLKGNYAIESPELTEILKDFTLDEETVSLTTGNISGYAPNVEKGIQLARMSFKDGMTGFKYLSSDPLIAAQFDNERLDAKVAGAKISVTVSGGFGIDDLNLTGKYSRSDGYRISMTLTQESYLAVELDAEVHSEIVIPLFGIDIPFGIGRVTGGVYAVVGMDGTLNLQIAAREMTSTTLGVRGSTKFYIPTSAHKIFDASAEMDGDTELSGKINGYLKFGPMAGIEIFGFDMVAAGLLLGAGVDVQSEGKILNVELYGILDIYVKFAGEKFNLARWRPTIYKKTQADTAGYKVNIMEAYIKPGRVGGIMQEETDDPNDQDGYVPAPNVPYKILVVPEGTAFNSSDSASFENNSAIRKYPSSGYYSTNAEGEFIYKDADILKYGDKAYLMFLKGDDYYISDPAEAVLPFKDITLDYADYFNDYATGQVQPVKVINWEATPEDPAEEQYEYAYYDYSKIFVNPYHSDIAGGQAKCITDEKGRFDTSLPRIEGGKIINNHIDIKPTYRDELDFNILKCTSFALTIDFNGAVLTRTIGIYYPEAPLSFQHSVIEVENSHKRYYEGDKIVDSMAYDEYIWITNTLGTRAVTNEEFLYSLRAFTTQDFLYRVPGAYSGTALANYTGNSDWNVEPITVIKAEFSEAEELFDINGQPTGTTELHHRIVVEWVWQPHPNPVTIVSSSSAALSTAGGEITVTAEGVGPFDYSLINAPFEVTIDEETGIMTVAPGIAAGYYTFIVRADESLILLPYGAPDPREGNDAVPAEQLFELTIGDPTHAEGIASVIASGDYELIKLVNGGPLITTITLTAGAPAEFSLIPIKRGVPVPDEITIESLTGELTVASAIEIGEYLFAVIAVNAYGGDAQIIRVEVISLADVINTSEADIIIRCDHPLDYYTEDRFTVDGANYIRWDSFAGALIEGVTTETSFIDMAPVSENYHYFQEIDVPENVIEEMEQRFSEMLSDYLDKDIFMGAPLNSDILLDGVDQYIVNPLDELTYNEYGPLVDLLIDKGGYFTLDLDTGAGAFATGKYFDALKEHYMSSLTFEQAGASITFHGKDIDKDKTFEEELYDFGFTDQAPDGAAMLAALPEGGNGFTYAFNHHGELPGMAEFAITTGYAEGEKVNVYKFDSTSDKFTLIAENTKVTAGGKVIYKNNSMSEYIITTSVIEGAEVSDTVYLQTESIYPVLYALVAVAVAVTASGAALIISFKRRKAI